MVDVDTATRPLGGWCNEVHEKTSKVRELPAPVAVSLSLGLDNEIEKPEKSFKINWLCQSSLSGWCYFPGTPLSVAD